MAIELAAARVRSIPPAAMAELLREARQEPAGQGLALLARGGPRGAGPDRHASMQRVVEWSWRLLEPALARLLAGVTVFQGGFGAAAAAAVCAGEGDAGGRPISLLLDDLVAHSLLRAVEPGDRAAARYACLERVREYAALQLDPPRGAGAAGAPPGLARRLGYPVCRRRRRWPSCDWRCPTSSPRWPAPWPTRRPRPPCN